MCGIYGVFSNRRTAFSSQVLSRAVSVLAARAQSRGKDSSGLVLANPATAAYQVFKGAIPVTALLRDRGVTASLASALDEYASGARPSFAAMGHSRLVTNGTQRADVNNQPVVKDGIIGIHNGIIVNDAALWARHPELKRDYQIDTEVLLALVRHSLDAGRGLAAAIAEPMREVEGTVSVALLVPDRAALVLYTNHGSLYRLTDERGLVLFASEYYPLRVAAAGLRDVLGGQPAIHQLVSGSGVILDLASFTLERFATAPPQGRPGPGATAAPAATAPPDVRVTAVADGTGLLELLPDVAAIARAPEAARYEAMLEHHHDRVARLRRCSRCILPETFPFIAFDADGVCNYCRNYKLKNQPRPVEELLALVEPYRRKGGAPDCIVPYSGGRDSTYALHVARTVLGLNPIAYTYDWGMVTDLGRRNIARVCGKLGVEHIIVAADIHGKRRNIRRNLEAWLKRPHVGMVPLFMAGDKYFYWYVEQVKRQTGIALNLWGINPLENTDFKVGFLGVPPDHLKEHVYSLSLKRQLTLFRNAFATLVSNPRYLNRSVPDTLGGFFARSIMPHRDYFHLFDFMQWDEREIETLILEEYDWEKAIDTDTTWRIGDGTAAFYNYIYFTVAGFSEHDTFRSNQIREGAIGRDEALCRVAVENRPRYPTIRWYTDAVGVDFAHAVGVINRIPKLYA